MQVYHLEFENGLTLSSNQKSCIKFNLANINVLSRLSKPWGILWILEFYVSDFSSFTLHYIMFRLDKYFNISS